MRIVSTGETTVVQTPAKINLTLDILGRRPDGFHELETILCPVAVFDEVQIQLTVDSEIDVAVVLSEQSNSFHAGEETAFSDDPAWDIPQDASNLAARAVAILRQRIGDPRGVNIKIVKSIPAAAGLGGGSSNAAAAVVAYLVAMDRWNRDLAGEVAASLGSDVPFFLGNTERIGVAHATGRGEECQFEAIEADFSVLLTHPPAGCSTVAIYREFAKQNSWTPRRGSAIGMLEALREGNEEKIGAGLLNALQSSARELNPWIDVQLDLLRGLGLKNVLMSGSGSACFALFADENDYTELRRRAVESGIPRIVLTRGVSFPSIEQQIDGRQSG